MIFVFCKKFSVLLGQLQRVGEKNWGLGFFFSLGSDVARGVSIFIRNSLDCRVSKVTCDQVGRCISVDIDIKGISLRLISVYFPQIDCSIRESEVLIEFLESVCSTSRTVIMSGDFNFVEDLSLDKRTPLPLSRTRGNSRVETFVNFRSFFNLHDPFRFLHPMRVEFSHRQTVYGGFHFLDWIDIMCLLSLCRK